MKLERLVEGYRLYCQAEGKSPYTSRWYMGKLRIFLQYLHNGGHSTEAIRASVVTFSSRLGRTSTILESPLGQKGSHLQPFRATYE